MNSFSKLGFNKEQLNILIRKSEGKRQPRRSRYRWEDIRMDLREIGWEGVNWIYIALGTDQWWDLLNTVMNFWVP
jgi:hypothetical protein